MEPQDTIRKLRGKPPATAVTPQPERVSAPAPRRRWVAPVSAGIAALLSITLGWFLSSPAPVNDRLENRRGKVRVDSKEEAKAGADAQAPDYEVVDTPVFRIYFPKSNEPNWRPGQDLPN